MEYQADGTGYGTEPKLALAGERSYPINYGKDGAGLMIRLNNMLDSGIDFRVSECKSDLIEFERKLTSAKAEFGKPFASAELIKEKRAPLKELDDELNLDANKEAEYEHNEEPDVPAPEKSRSLSDILSDAQRRSEEQAALHQGEYSRPELQY